MPNPSDVPATEAIEDVSNQLPLQVGQEVTPPRSPLVEHPPSSRGKGERHQPLHVSVPQLFEEVKDVIPKRKRGRPPKKKQPPRRPSTVEIQEMPPPPEEDMDIPLPPIKTFVGKKTPAFLTKKYGNPQEWIEKCATPVRVKNKPNPKNLFGKKRELEISFDDHRRRKYDLNRSPERSGADSPYQPVQPSAPPMTPVSSDEEGQPSALPMTPVSSDEGEVMVQPMDEVLPGMTSSPTTSPVSVRKKVRDRRGHTSLSTDTNRKNKDVSFEGAPSYFKVAKHSERDDVARHNPHRVTTNQNKRGFKRKSERPKTSTPIISSEDDTMGGVVKTRIPELNESLLIPRKKTFRRGRPCVTQRATRKDSKLSLAEELMEEGFADQESP